MADEIPQDCVLNRVRIITDDGEYEIVVAIDGEWVRTVSGRDWLGAFYGKRYLKLHPEDGDYQQQSDGYVSPHQYFRTADGLRHSHGLFININDQFCN